MVSVSDFAIIGRIRKPGPEGLRRLIAAVWIIQVHPQEKRLTTSSAQPLQSLVNARTRLPLHQPRIIFKEAAAFEDVVIKIKASVQPPAAVQNIRAHDPGRVISLRLKRLGNTANLWLERLACKVLDTIVEWKSSGEQAGVARQSERDLGVGLLE